MTHKIIEGCVMNDKYGRVQVALAAPVLSSKKALQVRNQNSSPNFCRIADTI